MIHKQDLKTSESVPATASSLVAISSVSNAGGEGKTTIALAVEASLDLLGRASHLVDIDQGNGSLAHQREDTKSLDWGMPAPKADVVFNRLRDRNIVFDFGANTLAAGAPVVQLYDKVTNLLAKVGFRRIALVPISTNKPGGVGAARVLIRSFSHMDCYPVLVNRDGSNVYDEDVSDLSALTMPYLQPVLQTFRSARQQQGINLADVLRSPPAGWTVAADYLAMWLRSFATQPAMVDILGGDIGPVLERAGRQSRPPLMIKVRDVAALHDDVIGEQLRMSEFVVQLQRKGVWRVLHTHGLTPSGLRAAADELERGLSI